MENNKTLSNFIHEILLDYYNRNHREYHYFAVGAGPRTLNLDKFTCDIDQIYPKFLKEIKDKTIRVTHFDPIFKNKDRIDFLDKYFTVMNFSYDDSEGIHCWRSYDQRVEIFVIPNELDIPNEMQFITALVNHHIIYNSYLVFQEYYGLSNGGNSLFKISRHLYSSLEDEKSKDIYKKKILFDITYGEAHCMTNMETSIPFVDDNGDFINLCILSKKERLTYLDTQPNINSIINKDWIKIFFN
jgi:hypothetical protein